jgi:hypothetical protein
MAFPGGELSGQPYKVTRKLVVVLAHAIPDGMVRPRTRRGAHKSVQALEADIRDWNVEDFRRSTLSHLRVSTLGSASEH